DRPPSPRAKGPPAVRSVPRVRDPGRAALGRRHPALVPRLTVATSPAAQPPADTLSSENGGKLLRYLTAGESHGPALAVVVEGLPAGLPITIDEIAAELARRRLGFGRGPRMRFERDDVERASARETAARVAAGSLAKGLLSHLGAEVVSHVIQLGPVRAAEDRRPVPADLPCVDESPVRCFDPDAEAAMITEIEAAAKA